MNAGGVGETTDPAADHVTNAASGGWDRSPAGQGCCSESGTTAAGGATGARPAETAWPRPLVLVGLLLMMGVTILTLIAWLALTNIRANLAASRGAAAAGQPGAAVPSQNSSRSDRLPILGAAPTFSLIDQGGRPFSSDALSGRVWVVDFIFTYCAGPCPVMTANMARLQEKIADAPAARLVSISVDPQRDTPEVLAAYAQRFGADPARWYFLTGDLEAIKTVAVDGFKLGGRDDPILHSEKFVLVDQRGRIRGYYDVADSGSLDELASHVRALEREPAE